MHHFDTVGASCLIHRRTCQDKTNDGPSSESIKVHLSFAGNSFVILVFIKYTNLRTITNYYVISLSVADLLVGQCVFYCGLVFTKHSLRTAWTATCRPAGKGKRETSYQWFIEKGAGSTNWSGGMLFLHIWYGAQHDFKNFLASFLCWNYCFHFLNDCEFTQIKNTLGYGAPGRKYSKICLLFFSAARYPNRVVCVSSLSSL